MWRTFRETWPGLRRNTAMAIAVIVTMSVSLSLSGVGLPTFMEVDLVKGRWYNKAEISVLLCVECSTGDVYEPGRAIIDAQRKAIEEAPKVNPEIKEVLYESKKKVFKESQRVFKDSPVLASRTVEQMQDSFRIKLLNPESYKGVVSEAQGPQGIQNVRDLGGVLDPVFNTLGRLQWATTDVSIPLLLTAVLQISITIRMAAFARRREIGIMRLVGISNFYTLLPFLLGSLTADLIGVFILSSSIAITYLLLIERTIRPSIPAIVWIGANYVFNAIIYIAAVSVALSVILTPLVTRKCLGARYVRRSRRIGLFPTYSKTPSLIESPAVWLPRS